MSHRPAKVPASTPEELIVYRHVSLPPHSFFHGSPSLVNASARLDPLLSICSLAHTTSSELYHFPGSLPTQPSQRPTLTIRGADRVVGGPLGRSHLPH